MGYERNLLKLELVTIKLARLDGSSASHPSIRPASTVRRANVPDKAGYVVRLSTPYGVVMSPTGNFSASINQNPIREAALCLYVKRR
jgi:hypothetical protein